MSILQFVNPSKLYICVCICMYVCVHMHFVCVCVCGREEVVQKINPGPHAFMHAGQVLYY